MKSTRLLCSSCAASNLVEPDAEICIHLGLTRLNLEPILAFPKPSMQKTLWIILAALLVAIGEPDAHAQTLTYIIAFTETPRPWPQGPLPSYGYFIYNFTTNQFLSFVVNWDGLVFDLTSMANNPSYFGEVPCLSGATGALATFVLMTACPEANPQWFGGDAPRFGFSWESDTPRGSVVIIGFRPDASIPDPTGGACGGDCTGGDFTAG